ncbi:MAG TPA: elongation factor G [Planctomycetota bacterium]|nr:elongation factor G [Planctomycetota bacterium]
MSKRAPADLRNTALVGHGDAGKTTLAERMLFKAGATSRPGSVKDRTSLFDYEPDEKERGHSIDAALAHFEWKGKDVNLVDCPGYPDYFGETVTGVAAADLVLVCVNAHAGVLVGTLRAWNAAEARQRAKAIVVTKTDLESKRLGAVLDDVRAAFGPRCLPYFAPPGVGDYRKAWTEAAVEADDALMLRYLEGAEITEDELLGAARKAVAKGLITPVVFVSAEQDDGVDRLLDLIVTLGPSPLDVPRRLVKASEPDAPPELIAPDPAAPFRGTVYKVQIDKHVGRIVHVRVLTGTLRHGDSFVVVPSGRREKAGHIFRPQGKEQKAIDSAGPGDLVALSKVEALHLGDTLAHENDGRIAVPSRYPRPMFGLAIRPKNRADEVKLAEATHKLAEESPTFTVKRDPTTGELVASGLSPLHVDVMLRRLKDRYGMEVETHKPRVPYKETINAVADGHYRHKKQSGGRGQFAEVFLRVEPAPPGAGLVWKWEVFGGSVPRNYESAIEKGVREAMARGVIAGYPIEDVTVAIVDGKHHDVDSSDAAFKIAGSRAFRDAALKARPGLLEPIMELEATVPAECLGDVSGDLNTRRARIRGMDQHGELQVIQADIPLSEAQEYARIITSLTSGRGSYTLEPSRFEHAPAGVQQQIVAAWKPHKDEDE